MFIIRAQTEVVIFQADSKIPYFKPKIHIKKEILPRDTIITGVVPGDYDGDSQMDVLLTTQIQNSKQTTVFIFWGNNQTLDMSGWIMLNKTFTDQPLVMDFNGDMIPDIFGVTNNVTEVCYVTNRIPVWRNALSLAVNMRIPHSNAFIDLNKDLTAAAFSSLWVNVMQEQQSVSRRSSGEKTHYIWWMSESLAATLWGHADGGRRKQEVMEN
ncbi:hypothetical protein NQZ68_001109 [Dissostichus eleginoides]|nr:hypothetical protein NQZ68_001109 [Dissostichus eleginoides]